MKRAKILEIFRMFAQSQGFYGRLLRDIELNPEWGDNFLNELEEQNFKDWLDLVLYIEG